MNNTVVCITTLNEELTVTGLVKLLISYGHDVIVSDGGSTDKTVELAERAGAMVLTTKGRLGIGPALVKAIHHANEIGWYDRYIIMDAGGSHSVLDIAQMLKSDADVVVGSRFMPGSQYVGGFLRPVMSRLASLACNLGSPVRCSDWTSGFRVYTYHAALAVETGIYRAEMHGWQIEVLNRLFKGGFSMEEKPILYRAGRSSFTWPVAWEAFKVWWRFFWRID